MCKIVQRICKIFWLLAHPCMNVYFFCSEFKDYVYISELIPEKTVLSAAVFT